MKALSPLAVVVLLLATASAAAAQSVKVTVLPERPTTADSIQILVSQRFGRIFGCPFLFAEPVVNGRDVFIGAHIPSFPVCPPGLNVRTLGRLPAGSYTLRVQDDDSLGLLAAESFEVVEPGLVAAGFPLEVSPTNPTVADRIDLRVDLDARCANHVNEPQLIGDRILFELASTSTCPPSVTPNTVAGSLGPLPAGDYTVLAVVDGNAVTTRRLTVSPTSTTLHLLGSQFDIRLDRTSPAGPAPQAVQLSTESGYFWFFDSSNVEVTAKLLDGRAVTGHYWLFLASMTDVGFTVNVVDRRAPLCAESPAGCPSRTYEMKPGQNANLIDLDLF